MSQLEKTRSRFKSKWPTWAVEWRGKITRDVGVEYEQQPNWEMAKSAFLNRYPHREVLSVSRVETTNS